MTDDQVGVSLATRCHRRLSLVQYEEMAYDMQSMQLDDDRSSMYFINDISDESDGMTNQRQRDEHSKDVPAASKCLVVTSVPHELFTDPAMKVRLARR